MDAMANHTCDHAAEKARLKHHSELFNDEKYSDLGIWAPDKIFAHKMVVCAQSRIIDEAVSGKFEHPDYVGIFENGEIWMRKYDDFVTGAIIGFMYGLEYQEAEPASDAAHLMFHVQIYIAAIELEVPALAEYATSRFLAEADFGDFENLDSFMEAVRFIYKEEQVDLTKFREKVVAVAVSRAEELLQHTDSGIYPFRKLLVDDSDFAADFKLALAEQKGVKQHQHCSICHMDFTIELGIVWRFFCPYCGKMEGLLGMRRGARQGQ